MVKLTLQICCNLENLHQLYLPESAEWYVRTKCSNCQEESERVYFNLNDKVEMFGSKGTANYVAKCKLCERTGSLEYCVNTLKKYSSSDVFANLATFECRGLEPFEFFPGDKFVAESTESDEVFG